MGDRDTNFDAAVVSRTLGTLDGARSVRRTYGRAAFATAIDDGLMPNEVRMILGGRRIVDAFPVRWGESLPAYAERTVAEMMVAYLRDDLLDLPGRRTSHRNGRLKLGAVATA